MTARDRAASGEDDAELVGLPSSDYDELWLMAVDNGDGLTSGEAESIMRFRERDTSIAGPSFVADKPGDEIRRDPGRLEIFKDYIRNAASWPHPARD